MTCLVLLALWIYIIGLEAKNMVKNNSKVNILRIFHKSNTSAVPPNQAQTLEAEEVSELSQ